MSRSVDVFVVGAGTAGAAVARACARRGLSVVAIDRNPLSETGARWVNGVPGHAFDQAELARPVPPELTGSGHPFHMVAGFGPGRVTVPSADLLDVDMRHLVQRLQTDAQNAGARLSGEETARAWEPDNNGASIRTSHATWHARVVVDASGIKGVPFAPSPPVPRTDLCAAAQEVRSVRDTDAARRFFEGHGVAPGDTLCFTGVSGGYSIVNVRFDPTHGTVSLLTGSIPAAGHPSGRALLDTFVERHSWVGDVQFGGARVIPIAPPLARLDDGPLVRIGDAARQVFAAHGSGIGAQLVAAEELATILADGGSPWDFSRHWHRTRGGHFCSSVAFARFSRSLTPEELRDLFASGLMAPGIAGRTLTQERPALGARDLPDIAAMIIGAAKAPRWLARMAPLAGVMARLELHHTRYPDHSDGVARWAATRDALLDRMIAPAE